MRGTTTSSYAWSSLKDRIIAHCEFFNETLTKKMSGYFHYYNQHILPNDYFYCLFESEKNTFTDEIEPPM